MSNERRASTQTPTKRYFKIPSDVTDAELEVIAKIINGQLPPETVVRPGQLSKHRCGITNRHLAEF